MEMKIQLFVYLMLWTFSYIEAKDSSLLIHDDHRKLRKHKKRIIRANGDPEVVRDESGKVRFRRSKLNLRHFILDDEEDDVDIQLMSDEEAQSIRVRRVDTTADPFESWYGMDKNTGSSFTMVKTVTRQGIKVITGTLYGKNGTIYQIRSLANGDVIAEEMEQDMFPDHMDGIEINSEDHNDIDPATIDKIDGLPSNGRQLRRLDSSSEIDIMVSL